jgi:hypothetical protein
LQPQAQEQDLPTAAMKNPTRVAHGRCDRPQPTVGVKLSVTMRSGAAPGTRAVATHASTNPGEPAQRTHEPLRSGTSSASHCVMRPQRQPGGASLARVKVTR